MKMARSLARGVEAVKDLMGRRTRFSLSEIVLLRERG